MYLWTIMKRLQEELIKKVYEIQKTVKTPVDWAVTIKEDLSKYDINLTDEEIKKTSKYVFSKIVRKKVDKSAMEYLNGKAAKHSKSIDLMKTDRMKEKYIVDPRLSLSDCQLLFKLRTRMTPVKTNFPSMWNRDVACRLCNGVVEIESQEHLLKCSRIKQYVQVPEGIKYSDIFGPVDKQLEIVKIFNKVLRQQEIMLNCSI